VQQRAADVNALAVASFVLAVLGYVGVAPVVGPAFGTVKPGGLLWVCYPKGGRKAGTDLNRDMLWELMSRDGLAGVTLVAIDDTWSCMRSRPTAEVGT